MKKINIFGIVTAVWKGVSKKIPIQSVIDKLLEFVEVLRKMDQNKDEHITGGEVITYVLNKVIK